LEDLGSTAGIVAVAAAGIALLALISIAALALRLRRLRGEQRAVLGDSGQEDLVSHGVETRRRVEDLGAELERAAELLSGRMTAAEKRLEGSVSGSAVVRYDAFNETSGRQSSSVALLDERGNGVVLSAILQREQARVYAKPVRAGQSELELSPEEAEALRQAEESAGR
jgi:hypothetical protein